MIRVPHMDISQIVSRDNRGPSARTDEQPAPSGDFMAMIQQQVRAGESDQARGIEAAGSRGAERNELNRDARPAVADAETPRPEHPAAGADNGNALQKKPQDDQQAREERIVKPREASDGPRVEKAKVKRDKTSERGQHAGEAAEAAQARPDQLRAAVQAAHQSIKGLGDAAPEMRNLEKSLQAFQDMAVNGGERSKRLELFMELRMRMKDALQHLERREETAQGTLAEKIAGAKNRIKTLDGMMEGQIQGGQKNRPQSQPAPVMRDAQPQADAQSAFHRDMRQSIDRNSDTDNRDGGAGVNAGRNVQSQMRNAAQGAVPRMPLANEQFESIMNNARVVVRDGKNGSFIMNLYPESLGRVNINLGLEDGIIQGRFLVDSPEARELMIENLDQLRTQMEEAGIQVGSFQVNVRGERERLVRELQESLAGLGRREPVEAQRDYEIQSYRSHDGALDVIA